MSAYRPRWRTDASGHVQCFAGQWAGGVWFDRDALDEVVRAMPNGASIEVVKVGESPCFERDSASRWVAFEGAICDNGGRTERALDRVLGGPQPRALADCKGVDL